MVNVIISVEIQIAVEDTIVKVNGDFVHELPDNEQAIKLAERLISALDRHAAANMKILG